MIKNEQAAPPTDLAGKIAHHVREIPPSGIRRFFDLVMSMEDVVSLGVGEPDFPTPLNVRQRAIAELEKGRTSYTSNYGLLELRETIAEWLHGKYGLSYDPASEIVVTVGASEAIDLCLRALLNPGEEVIVVEPCYVSYAPTVILAGGVPVMFPTYQKDGFRLDIEALDSAVTPRTRAIMLNYPSNPTGATFTREDLESLAAFAQRHDVIIISDEIYSELTYTGQHQSIGALPGMKNYVVTISGLSKSHAMTGWRLGYLCAPEPLASAMLKIHQYTMLCAPTLSQFAGIEALRHGEEAVAAMRAEYEKRRNLIVSAFNGIGLKTLLPGGAFYAFASLEGTGFESSDRFCNELLAAERVAVVPGTAFGASGEGFIRASYASSVERIEIAAQRMGRFLGR